MSTEIVIGILSLVGTIIGSLSGILVSNKLVNYKIEELTKRVDKHNSTIERTYKLEERMAVVENDIKDIKNILK